MSEAAPSKINVFDYLDYRHFLKAWYARAKEAHGFSLRKFSAKAGFTSPNFLKMVMDGDRNLTEESLEKFCKALDLNHQEEYFFTNLVFFNQARNHERKDYFYRRLLLSPKFLKLKPIEKDQYEYYSTWYHPVVRELIVTARPHDTFETIAKRVKPAITAQQVRRSVELLARLKFIEMDEKGRWCQTTSCVTTGPEAGDLTMVNYHRDVLDVAYDLISSTKPEQRDVSALTLGIAKGRLGEIKKKIQEFRQEILKMVAGDNQPDQVVLLTLQLLPVTVEGNHA